MKQDVPHCFFPSGENYAYLEEIYQLYLKEPDSLDPAWRHYFSSLSEPQDVQVAHTAFPKQALIDQMVRAYRDYGHFEAQLNPLSDQFTSDPRLTLSHHQLSASDLQLNCSGCGVVPEAQTSLGRLVESLKKIYCGSIGVQYEAVDSSEERLWLQNAFEHRKKTYSDLDRKRILKQLTEAEGFEKYLDIKYVGEKRFSLEGSDVFIPMLHVLIEQASAHKMREIVLAMSHRGRLNTLVNVMGYPPQQLFLEFEKKIKFNGLSGDVKYHKGYDVDLKTENDSLYFSLLSNPSHLEFINPVLLGTVRARQESYVNGCSLVVPIQVHGDASFAGQGVVMETLNMSQTRAHGVGGSIHIIINNQVGFTTSCPEDARSSHYCSDLAKMLAAPVFHVNGDDPEAVLWVTQLAFEYRHTFHKDVFIDLVSYRRHGHQEVDEPTATQPLMYRIIRNQKTVRTLYAEDLIKKGIVRAEEEEAMATEYKTRLEQGVSWVDVIPNGLKSEHIRLWTPYRYTQDWEMGAPTGIPEDQLRTLGDQVSTFPEHFELTRSVLLMMQARKKMAQNEIPMDWGFAETLAYASLLVSGHAVRLVGEDARRGTFYHRHATLFDQKTGQEYTPLAHLSPEQAPVQIDDSLLSETGALGFEYGYSTVHPKNLTIWEAQFGDFANGAQVIMDQFISSGFQKWGQCSGLVLFLPHGYDGMGPEHSSARLERFLQLCAEWNMRVVVPTQPAQIFHLLREHIMRPVRQPLIVLTPKSLLRNKLAVSRHEDLTQGQFLRLIPELDEVQANAVQRVVFCAGKVFYDLLEARRAQSNFRIALIRLEQVYPFPTQNVLDILHHYSSATEIIFCQEEPKNQGAWSFIAPQLSECMNSHQKLVYVGRPSSAAPATGLYTVHQEQQSAFIHEALTL